MVSCHLLFLRVSCLYCETGKCPAATYLYLLIYHQTPATNTGNISISAYISPNSRDKHRQHIYICLYITKFPRQTQAAYLCWYMCHPMYTGVCTIIFKSQTQWLIFKCDYDQVIVFIKIKFCQSKYP